MEGSGHFLLLGLCALALPFIYYPQFLSNDALLYPCDSAQSYYPRFMVIAESLREEKGLPLWQTVAYAGSPFHANPENPTLYLPVLLLAALCSPLLAMNLTILIHLSLAMLGMYLLTLRLWKHAGGRHGTGASGAFLAAVFFGMNHFMRFEHFTLVMYGAAHALIPWIFLAGHELLHGTRPRRHAAWLAILLAGQAFTGGLYVSAYTALGLAVWFIGLGILGTAEDRRRTLAFGALAAGIAAAMVMAKGLPFLEWVDSTNRGGPLPLDEAASRSLAGYGGFDGKMLLRNLQVYTGGGPYLVLVLFALPLLRHGTVRMAFFLAVLGFLIALGPLYTVLHEWIPPFDRIRYAFRGWTLTNAMLPLLLGLGLNRAVGFLWKRIGKPGPVRLVDGAIGLAAGLSLLPFLCRDAHHFWEKHFDHPFSLEEVLRRYPNWTRMAASAGRDWRAVCLNVHHAGPALRNEQFIAFALGIETVAGYFGSAWPPALERHAYPDRGDLKEPGRLKRLAALSVRYYVYSRDLRLRPLTDEALESEPFPGGIDGERIGENLLARPRAFVPARAAALFGDADRDVLYTIYDDPAFRADRASLIAYGPGELPGEGELEALDELVVVDGPGARTESFGLFLERAEAEGVRILRVGKPLEASDRDLLHEAAKRLSENAKDAPGMGRFERLSSREVRVTHARADQGRFLILSETWSLYDGWNVAAASRRCAVRSADGVSSAVYLAPGETSIMARYEPAGVAPGLLLLLLGSTAAVLLLLVPARGNSRAILH